MYNDTPLKLKTSLFSNKFNQKTFIKRECSKTHDTLHANRSVYNLTSNVQVSDSWVIAKFENYTKGTSVYTLN